jgi:hypothetical protein
VTASTPFDSGKTPHMVKGAVFQHQDEDLFDGRHAAPSGCESQESIQVLGCRSIDFNA